MKAAIERLKTSPKFLFIKGVAIVATASTITEAIKASGQHEDAAIYEHSWHKTRESLEQTLNYERMQKALEREENPLGKILADESDGMIQMIEQSIQSVVEGADMGMFFGNGTVRESTVKQRRGTNEECAIWDEDLTLPFAFDLRKSLPKQVSAWLLSQAKLLTEAAEAVANATDLRSLALMRRLVSEDGLAETMVKEGKVISVDGKKIVTQEEYNRQFAEIEDADESEAAAATAA
jgi:hypothetical protein